MMRPLLGLSVILALAGCAETETVTLRETATGFVTRCEQLPGSNADRTSGDFLTRQTLRACPSGAAALAWERVD